ncbi:MAG: response regulator [Proteobacteria bacterium]|nr:MAG: response regulator [Pseudomonadota bacterium]
MSEKPVLLFVDDEERIVKLLKIMFRSDYDTYTAINGREALAIMETVPVDVIISDQRMPEMTGIQLLSQVRERWPSTVRLLLTGYSDLVAIVGAVNEGEVYRFINKPWNQAELRAVVSDAVEFAQGSHAIRETVAPVWSDDNNTPFSVASQLLAIEGCDADRQEVVEMFTYDYRVHAAQSLKEAIEILSHEQIGVIVSNAEVDGIDITDVLAEIGRIDPAITMVVMTGKPSSETIINLINSGRIYRFAMQPLSPNLFRLAVHAAMREHHRRLADPRVVKRRMMLEASKENDS